MKRKQLVALLKLVLVGALMTFVATSIQWTDSYSLSQGEQQQLFEGEIIGSWQGESVRFVPAGGDEIVLVGGTQADGSTLEVRPGFLTYLRELELGLFLLGALCYLVSVTVAAARWWWLLRVNQLDVTLGEAQRFTWIGIFFNNIVPGQTGGDLIKAIYIMKRCPEGRVAALMSVLVDRILGLATLALLGAMVVLFFLEDFAIIAVGIWGVLAMVALMGVVAFSRRVRRLIRLDVILKKLPGKLSQTLQRVDAAVFFYRAHKKGLIFWLMVGTANHTVSILSVLLIGESLNVGMPLTNYFVLVPVINIVSAVPIAPNGWGVGEALYGELFGRFSPAGIPGEVMRTRGVALSVLYRVHLSMLSLLGGLILMFEKEKVTRADVEEELAREEQEEGSAGGSIGDPS